MIAIDISNSTVLQTLYCSESTMKILVMDSSQTTAVTKHSNTKTVRITQSANGKISYVNGFTFDIQPDAGYEVATLTVGGVSVTPSTTYTFSSLTADTIITATFKAID